MKSRSFYQCHKCECDSQALHQLKIRFHTVGPVEDRYEMQCTSTIKTCERHQRQAEEYLLSPENKTAISMKFMFEGLPPPDFQSLKAEWVPLLDGEMVEGAA